MNKLTNVTLHLRDEIDTDLQIVVPAINEERRIGETIEALCLHLADRPWRSGVIVVDNGSADATAEVVDLSHRNRLAVEVIGCRQRGKGAAVRKGILQSTARWVGYCDADLSTPVDCIDKAVGLLAEGWDIVVGSRRCAGAEYVIPQPLLRRCGSMAFRALASPIVGSISDTQCGFKLFQGDTARSLFRASQQSGFAFDIEILARAAVRGLQMIELPVSWADQEGSTFKPLSDGVRAVRDLIEVQRAIATDEGRP
jgi:glycosyltransferase involved in cell wall biosynthesis